MTLLQLPISSNGFLKEIAWSGEVSVSDFIGFDKS